MIGFVAIIFMLTMMPRSWLEARGVEEMRSGIEAQLQAISCMQFARQNIFSADVGEIENETGEYFAHAGNCEIVDVRQTGSKIVIQTRAAKNGTTIEVDTVLDHESLEIVSIEIQ
jgi:hypothetical protein